VLPAVAVSALKAHRQRQIQEHLVARQKRVEGDFVFASSLSKPLAASWSIAGWCGYEAALRHILHVTAHADELLKEPWAHAVTPRVEDWETHRCRHCR
jgi:hypothetical protein